MCRNCSEAGGNVLIFNAAHFKESLFFTLSYFHSPETFPRRESLPIISSSYDYVSLSVHSLSNASGFFRWDWRLTHSLFAWVKTRTEQYLQVMGKEEKAQSSLGWGRWRPILVWWEMGKDESSRAVGSHVIQPLCVCVVPGRSCIDLAATDQENRDMMKHQNKKKVSNLLKGYRDLTGDFRHTD